MSRCGISGRAQSPKRLNLYCLRSSCACFEPVGRVFESPRAHFFSDHVDNAPVVPTSAPDYAPVNLEREGRNADDHRGRLLGEGLTSAARSASSFCANSTTPARGLRRLCPHSARLNARKERPMAAAVSKWGRGRVFESPRVRFVFDHVTPEGSGDRAGTPPQQDRKSTRLNSSHIQKSRMPSSA